MLRRRLRTFTLWTGTTLSVLIAAAFVVSGWWAFAVHSGPFNIDIFGGLCVVGVEGWSDDDGFSFNRHGFGLSLWNDWSWELHVGIPIWAIFVLVSSLTALATKIPSRSRPGHCPCGYDLTGNESGRCPECGEPVKLA